MRSKAMLACLMASALGLGLGLVACSDDDSGGNNNSELCGNGALDDGEACDGNAFGGETCVTQGMNGGALACNADCTFDTSGCAGCGNGVIEVGEVCDGSNLDGQTCEDEGLISGALACAADCTGYDTSGCEDPGNECANDESLTLTTGEVMPLSVDTSTEDDTTETSCEDGTGALDHIYLITVDTDGDLVVNYGGDWLIFALFPEPSSAIDCFNQNSEEGCYDAYFDGPVGTFSDLTAGNYYLVVSDYDASGSVAHNFYLTHYAANTEICSNGVDDDGDGDTDCDDTDCATNPFCLTEICDNGVDDNLNGLVDCLEFSCVGDSACTGGVCVADHDMGTINATTDATVTFDTTDASDNYDLSCGTVGNAEYVIAFNLDADSLVSVEFNQSAADANVLGFYFEGPTGNTCVDQEVICQVPGGTTVSGSLSGTTPLPPGNYYFIVEADNGGGPATAHFTVELVCPAGEHEEGGVCVANTCQATDLGTFSGTQILIQGDSCTGTTWYSPALCTGWPADAEELTYSVTLSDGATINVTQTPINGGSQDTSLYLLDDCVDWAASGCLVGADDTMGGEAETVSYTNNTGALQVVYIVADGYSGCGEFELTID